jgi:hypothetical protein
MNKISNKLIVTLVAAVMIVTGAIASSTPVQAASTITIGGSCRLSANWLVNISVTYNNTNGSPSTGTFRYAVMDSPGPLYQDTVNGSSIQGRRSDGSVIWSGSDRPSPWKKITTTNGRYVYRFDPWIIHTGNRYVEINPRAATSGVRCSDYSFPSKVFSQN